MRYTIKMKDYIQPFEIKLAEMELSSIVGEENIYKIDNLKYSIETNEEVCNSLVKKLTYWETIEGNVTRTIFQTEIESSGTASYRKLQPISGKQMIFDIESGIIYNHSKNRASSSKSFCPACASGKQVKYIGNGVRPIFSFQRRRTVKCLNPSVHHH